MSTVGEHGETVGLPDFCTLPVLFALLVVAALVVALMLLAPGVRVDFTIFSTAALFAMWLALTITVVLCKARPLLQRLPRVGPYLAAWALMVTIVLVAAAVVWWLDEALGLGLVASSAPRFLFGSGAATALVGLALLRYFYILAQWQQRLRAVSQARVEALQARIRPHFLFNSMNTVAALVRVDPAAAERTLEDLAELFRAALGQEGMGTLGQELALVDCYLDIEQRRLGERLRVERDLSDLPLEMPLPRLLLQPLVENAVHHGIQPRREGGSVRLSGRRTGEAVEIVIDNPLGDGPATPGHGHGLDSVRQRIGYHFGERGALETRIEDGRFVVVVRLPVDAVQARAGMTGGMS